jgi:hypothetical protein
MQRTPLQCWRILCPVPNHIGRVERSEAEVFVDILAQSFENGEVLPKLIFRIVVAWNSVDG